MLEPLPLPKARLEALTDGIFAVSMTLLVLDLKFAGRVSTEAGRVFHDLLALLPYIDDYVISFLVLCVFWLAHLRLLRRVREVDATFVWLNLAFLLFTTFVPPLTSWIGHETEQPAAAMRAPTENPPRAIQMLEWYGDDDAVKLLDELASSGSVQARSALSRLRARRSPTTRAAATRPASQPTVAAPAVTP